MTRIALLLAVLAGCDDKGVRKFSESDLQRAELLTKKLAFEGYPMWAAAHADKECPAKLADLLEYVNEKDAKDPFGTELKMFCGANLPKGVRGLGIQSAGPDGKFDTADDIHSWDERKH
jgi:hypothetical protein